MGSISRNLRLFHGLLFWGLGWMGLGIVAWPGYVGAEGKPFDEKSEAKQRDRDLYFLSHPALEGRDAGTFGIEVAARYIADAFAKAGLSPVFVEGKKPSFFRPFDATTGIRLGQGGALETRKSLEPNEGLKGEDETTSVVRRSWKEGHDYLPFAFSSSGSCQSQVVWAGYGISAPKLGYDDYKNLDVKGKIVLIFRYAPRFAVPKSLFSGREQSHSFFQNKLLYARSKGACAVLIVDPPMKSSKGQPSTLVPLVMQRGFVDAGILAAHIKPEVADVLLEGSGLLRQNLYDSTEATLQNTARLLPSRATLDIRLEAIKAPLKNVAGLVVGRDPKLRSEVIVVGAHYDHIGYGHDGGFPGEKGKIHPGADDNASGTAAILSMARFFARHPMPRTLLFVAFSGEERGLLGSAFFVKHPPMPLQTFVTMINLDMVGRLRKNTLIVQGSGTSPVFEALLKARSKAQKLDLRMGRSGYGPSDHTSFVTRDIPVLFFFTGAHMQYHRPTDTFDTLDLPGIGRVVSLVRSVLEDLAKLPIRPAYQKIAAPQRMRSPGGIRVSLGLVPSYGGEKTEGVLLSGVRPQSAADKAGLQKGDVLVQMGRFSIKNLYDVMTALRSFAPGEASQVSVIRSGKRITLSVVYGKLEQRQRRH